jgi:hypothetical protein
MEALPWPGDGEPGPMWAIPEGIPSSQGGYLDQPDMRAMISVALELGWSLWAYEAVFEVTPETDRAKLVSREFTNWREREQASNLCRVVAAAPDERLLVWCGNSHASKEADTEWVPMGHHFATMSGADAFVIDQTLSVEWPRNPQPEIQELLATLGQTLAAHGGTAGILRDQAPAPLDSWPGIDALVLSTDNAFT